MRSRWRAYVFGVLGALGVVACLWLISALYPERSSSSERKAHIHNAGPRTYAENYRDSGAACGASSTSRSLVPG